MNKKYLKFIVPIAIVFIALLFLTLSIFLKEDTKTVEHSGTTGSVVYVTNTESTSSVPDYFAVKHEDPSTIQNYFDCTVNNPEPMQVPDTVYNSFYEDYCIEEIELILGALNSSYPIDKLVQIKSASTTDYMITKCCPYSFTFEDKVLLCYIYNNIVYIKEK